MSTSAGIQTTYYPTSGGSIHARIQDSIDTARHPPLICLHPAPFSSLYFTTAMPLLANNRRVIAPDYPGYGGSALVVDAVPAIRDYAAPLTQTLDSISPGEPVDLLGFHTGCLVAVEMALIAPERVRRLILIDVPYFHGETQRKLHAQMASPLPLGPELGCLQKSWEFNVQKRLNDMTLARAFSLFVESIRSGQQDYYGFHAAFSYDCLERFGMLKHSATVIATRSGLLEPTHAAAAAITDATLVDVTDVSSAVFEKGAATISEHIVRALSNR